MQENQNNDARSVTDGVQSTVHRRTIVKGIAWGVPVIAAAAAAPFAAASLCKPTNQIGLSYKAQSTTSNWATGLGAVKAVAPAGARMMKFTVVGGGGAGYFDSTSTYGRAAFVSGELAVNPGETYWLLAGAGGEASPWLGGQGRGGKSLYGNGGNGSSLRGGGGASGGGAASALVRGATVTGAADIVVAGGGGGAGMTQQPTSGATDYGYVPYWGSFDAPMTLRSGGSVVPGDTGTGGSPVPNPGYTGTTGWIGYNPSYIYPPPASTTYALAPGGRGGTMTAAGAGGATPTWSSDPYLAVRYSSTAGFAGTGHHGGAGAPANVTYSSSSLFPYAGAGGGGGGYFGGGGGAWMAANWTRPPYPYSGEGFVAGSGGGGSSYWNTAVQNVVQKVVTNPINNWNGVMGYVEVSFWGC